VIRLFQNLALKERILVKLEKQLESHLLVPRMGIEVLESDVPEVCESLFISVSDQFR
jgi:hypothetical protein